MIYLTQQFKLIGPIKKIIKNRSYVYVALLLLFIFKQKHLNIIL